MRGIEKGETMGFRVYPWELGPQVHPAGDVKAGECHVELNAIGYEVWWQKHPENLVYALVRTETEAGRALQTGAKTVVAYLVYDLVRSAIVAIYGTALDNRPFVDAFGKGLIDIVGERDSV